MSDYNQYDFTVKEHDVVRVLREAKSSGCSAMLYINGMFYDVEQSKKPKRNRELLAHLIADVFMHIDPYNGADREDIYSATLEELKTLEGCYNILRELSALIMN